jgi:hypothetical protein
MRRKMMQNRDSLSMKHSVARRSTATAEAAIPHPNSTSENGERPVPFRPMVMP